MTIFLQAVALVSDLPGSLVYHLLLLFVLGFSAAIALGQWRREHVVATGRLALAATGIFVLQFTTFLAALLAGLDLLDPLVVVPPLDRAASTLALVLLVWAFAFPDPLRPADAVFGGAAFLVLLALAISLGLWVQEVAQQNTPFYNGSPQESGWEIAQIVLLALGVAVLGVRHKSEWPIGIGLLIVLLAGHLIHYRFPLEANLPGAERLAEIVAFPMFAAMVYRRVHPAWAPLPMPPPAESLEATWPRPAVRPPVEAPAEAETPAQEARPSAWMLDPKAAVALASLNASARPEEAAQVLTLALAHTFNADLCLLITPPDSSGAASIACSYDLITEKFRSGAALPPGELPTVDLALRQRQAARLTTEEHEAELRRLAAAAGLKQTGPALVAPLAVEDSPLLGAVVLLSPYAKRNWSEADQELLEAMAEPLATTLEAATRLTHLNQEIAEKQAELGRAQADLRARQTELDQAQADLRAEQSESARLGDELTEARLAVQYTTEQLRAQREVESRQAAAADDVSNLRARLQAEQEREEMKARLQEAERQAEEYQSQAVQLAAELDRVRAELDRLAQQNAAPTGPEALALFHSELELAQRQFQESQQRELDLQAELERARAELDYLKADQQNLAQADAEARASLRSELELAQRQLTESQQRELELKAALERSLSAGETRPLGFPVESASLQAELEQAQRQLAESREGEIRLAVELDRLRAERDQLEAEALSPLRAELGQAQRQAAASQQRERELAAALQAAQTEIEQLKAGPPQAGAQETIARLQSELMFAQRQAEGRNRLLVELSEARERLQALSTSEAKMREEGELLRQQEAQLRKELELTRAELKKAAERASPFGAPAEKLNELEAALADAQADLARQAALLAEAKEQLARKDRQIGKVQAALLAAQAQALGGGALAEKERELAQAQADLAEARTLANDLREQLAAAEAALAVRPDPAILAALQEKLAAQERQFAQAQTELKAALAAANTTGATPTSLLEVVASLTQDLRQPLSSIVGYSELLLGESVGILGALQKKFLERIQASSERMSALLDDLIRVTAIDSGPLKLLREKVEVMSVVEEAILNCSSQFREKGINLRLDLADDLPQVQADRDALRQIMLHLLNNAGSASAIDGEVVLSVKRESEQKASGERADYIFISVRDSGGGIRAEDQPRVFSRVYRADAPLVAGLGDTGVGLSVAKALVEAHGGRIWLTSEMGVGSTFNLLLPVEARPSAAPPPPNGADEAGDFNPRLKA